MIGDATRSGSDKLLISDAFARRGQYDRAIEVLRSALQDDPRDFEAWLALGNSLIEHADGRLTPAALFAFTRAASLEPRDPTPQYFVGISLIRQGRLMEARSVWAEAVAAAPEDAEGRAALEQRLARLEELLRQMSGRQEPPPAEAQ
jgi:cytochrome c-type biogenesis protein CcmH